MIFVADIASPKASIAARPQKRSTAGSTPNRTITIGNHAPEKLGPTRNVTIDS